MNKYQGEELLTRWRLHVLDEEKSPDGIHPDGCFHCGGKHPTDACTDKMAVWETFRYMEENEDDIIV